MMSKRKTTGWMLTAALLAGFVGAAPRTLVSSARANMADLTGEQIIEKYIEVTGGRDAYEKVKSRITTGKLAVPAQGLDATITTYQKAPNLTYSKIDLGGFGVVERGYNGEVGWEKNPQTGTRIVEGDEKTQMVREAELNNELDWKKQYTKVENKGVEEVDGKKCYKVEMTEKDGNVQTRFYNVETGLMDQMQMTVKNPMGELPVVVTISDYRTVDGIKLPFKASQLIKSMGMTYELTTERVEPNADIPADKFELPADVKALLEKSPASEPAPTQPSK
ncbi:hypothetical protein BH09PLA1_BH09PLA1_21870 [soil metagenome]